jgi:hypothetical protein
MTQRLERISGIALLASLFTFTACALSVDPVISESEARFDEGLLGTWRELATGDVATIERGEGTVYAIHYETDDGRFRLRGRLGRIGGRDVLDVWPDPSDDDVKGTYSELLVPGHVLLLLDVHRDSISTAILDPDQLKNAFENGVIRLDYSELEDQLILHGGTKRLVAELAAVVADENMMLEASGWTRANTRTKRNGRE